MELKQKGWKTEMDIKQLINVTPDERNDIKREIREERAKETLEEMRASREEKMGEDGSSPMDRWKAISIIETHYPTDSQYERINAIGERLLAQAKRECEDWRNLPLVILARYAELCQQEENRAIREWARQNETQ